MFGANNKSADFCYDYIKSSPSDIIVAVAGNPNVGKSTLFNAITGMKQHTGNWAGKTVENARGEREIDGRKFIFCDLPGCYALYSDSAEETAAASFLKSRIADVAVVVCDCLTLERGLYLFLQVKKLYPKTVLCINLMDEAEKRGINIDMIGLEKAIGSPVAATQAVKKKGINELIEKIREAYQTDYPEIEEGKITKELASKIYTEYVKCGNDSYTKKDRLFNDLLTGKYTAVPCMLLMLVLIFWITLKGANYPSQLLSGLLFGFEDKLIALMNYVGLPEMFISFFVSGVYRTLCWVVAVMAPPMMIFFPLFTLAEDCGILPRIAFNMDYPFNKCSACGKQALSMCMGFGCNAVGVTGCRIIDSPRERAIAVITNSLVPCNGRFPMLITLITVFMGYRFGSSITSAVYLTGFIVISIAVTFIISKILSVTILKGVPSFFALEMPPFRKPKIAETIVRSVFDRTIFVLGRAVTAAIPAGAVIWLAANIFIGDYSILNILADVMRPVGNIMGLDGEILLGFLFGFPANEIVLPIIIMSYTGGGALTDIADLSEIHRILTLNGWTAVTAVCTCIFSLFHWPCATTLKTIYKETGSKKYTALSVILPVAVGFIFCVLINFIFGKI